MTDTTDTIIDLSTQVSDLELRGRDRELWRCFATTFLSHQQMSQFWQFLDDLHSFSADCKAKRNPGRLSPRMLLSIDYNGLVIQGRLINMHTPYFTPSPVPPTTLEISVETLTQSTKPFP